MAYSHQDIIAAISQASESTGVDFSYLVNQAAAESSFDAEAKASSSSATGLYQFIESTWLSMMERYGEDYGLDTQGLSDDEILEMRNNPEASSFMAAAFASENERFLNSRWGGDVGSTELYFAHFMGATGASSFLNARDENPIQAAADLFPRAARSNPNVFYDSETGDSRTMEEVYAFFDKKFNNEETTTSTIAMAKNTVQDNVHSSDTDIMQRANALREASYSRSSYAKALYESADDRRLGKSSIFKKNTTPSVNNLSYTNGDPLSGLLAQPLDLMMLAQISVPGKTILDESDA